MTARNVGRSPAGVTITWALWGVLAALLALGFAIDGVVLAAVKPLHHSRLSDVINHTIRLLGTGYVQPAVALAMIALGAFVSRRLKQSGAWTLLAFVVSGVSVNILKVLAHRPRPWTTEPPPTTWWGYLHDSSRQSFPSAETATTFAVALTVGAWYPALRVPLVIIAALVGLARVVVGSHHPSDVVAGVVLGLAVSQFLTGIARRRQARSSETT